MIDPIMMVRHPIRPSPLHTIMGVAREVRGKVCNRLSYLISVKLGDLPWAGPAHLEEVRPDLILVEGDVVGPPRHRSVLGRGRSRDLSLMMMVMTS